MLFKRSFGLTRSFFDCLGFGMLFVETAVFDCICWFSSSRDRKGQSYPVKYYLESVEGKEYFESKIHKSELKPGNGYVNTVYFVIQAREILESVARRLSGLLTMNEHAIANIYLYLSFLLRKCS